MAEERKVIEADDEDIVKILDIIGPVILSRGYEIIGGCGFALVVADNNSGRKFEINIAEIAP